LSYGRAFFGSTVTLIATLRARIACSHRVPGLFHEIIDLLLDDVEKAECRLASRRGILPARKPEQLRDRRRVYAIKVGYWSWLPLKQLAAERINASKEALAKRQQHHEQENLSGTSSFHRVLRWLQSPAHS